MEPLLSGLEALPIARALRASTLAYPLVNAGHLLGLAALFGSILVLDLRMLGVWRSLPVDAIGRPAVTVAATGLVLSIITGGLLFVARAEEYAANPVFWTKLAFVGVGVTNAAGMRLLGGDRRWPALAAAVSLSAWTGAIIAGRLIGYFGP